MLVCSSHHLSGPTTGQGSIQTSAWPIRPLLQLDAALTRPRYHLLSISGPMTKYTMRSHHLISLLQQGIQDLINKIKNNTGHSRPARCQWRIYLASFALLFSSLNRHGLAWASSPFHTLRVAQLWRTLTTCSASASQSVILCFAGHCICGVFCRILRMHLLVLMQMTWCLRFGGASDNRQVD